MSIIAPPTADSWLRKAREFIAKENWIGALSSVRNALRLEVKNLKAWHMGCEVAMRQDRQYAARRYAKALRRFSLAVGNHEETEFAGKITAEIEEYYATYHRRMGETDLTHFAARGDLAKVRDLLAAGTDPNERNNSGWTALHKLGIDGAPEMARFLVQHGADLEAADSLQETPLIKACTFGNKKLVPVLIELGANINHAAKERHTALWYAISSMKDLGTVRLLIEHGADPNEEYLYGQNAFLLAVYAQKPAVVNYLLPLVSDVARLDKHDVCAISFSASYNDVDLIKKLLQRGVSANQVNSYGHTPIMSAAEHDSLAAARLLLEHGADPLARSKYGESAVSIAERRGNVAMCQLLAGKN